MSRILPEPVVGRFSPEVLEVYRALKAIPDEDVTVWVSLPLPEAAGRPHFLAVVAGRLAFLVAVCGAGQSEVEEAAGLSLFSSKAKSTEPGQAERDLLQRFLEVSLPDGPAQGADNTARGMVIFPHVTQSALNSLDNRSLTKFFGAEVLSAGRLAEVFRQDRACEIDGDALAALRSAFTPESVVPAHFSPSRKYQRNIEARLAPMLLDFDQEHWAKQKLVLSPEAAAVAEDTPAYGGASLVTGVAGSGKSLVLLFRACTQARLAPQSRALVLTHNKALKMELESRFGDLGRPRNVQWHTFFSWARSLLPQRPLFENVLQYQDRDRRIRTIAQEVWGDLSETQVEFLRDEIDWMQDRALDDESRYLEADRSGRIVRLGEDARRKVFKTFRQYRTSLDEEGREDWSGLALRFWHAVEARRIDLPFFDFIYIDEAQFFAPVWFYAIRQALRPGIGRMLLAADPTQGFLKRRQSWVACGLDLRGRSTKLHRSYRSTRRILEFAANFYRCRISDEEFPDLNLPGEEELSSAAEGETPAAILVGSRQDETARVVNEVAAYLDEGGDDGNVLVLVAGEFRVTQVLESFAKRFGQDRVRDAREPGTERMIRVCGINAATGLESPIVFLLGCADLLDAENSFNLKNEHRRELERDNTRRLYMAFTRAGSLLVFTWVGESLPVWCSGRSESNGI